MYDVIVQILTVLILRQIVCTRGRFHSGLIHGSDPALSSRPDAVSTLEQHQQAFRKLAANMENSMYFM